MVAKNQSPRFTVLYIVAFTAALGGALWLFRVPRGPTYGGKALSTWLDDWGSVPEGAVQGTADRTKREQAQIAIQQLGTNSIPSLLRMAGKKDSTLKKRFIALLNKQPLAQFRIQPKRYHDYRCKAAYGFGALGPAAQSAVPGLIRLLRDPDREVRANAAFCLHHIGPPASNAVPALIQALNKEGNGYGPFLINSMEALHNIHSYPELVVPVLREYLDGPRTNWNYSAPTMLALHGYGAQAKSVVPAILPFLNDPDPSKRAYAEMALSSIDPQALTQAKQK